MIKSNITDKRPRRDKFKTEINLISGGHACQTAFPDGKITVFPWDTSIDTWLTETVTKATGVERERVMYDLMSKVCNLNGCQLGDFYLGEVNLVLMTARAIQHDNTIEYTTVCPACNEEEVNQISVPGEMEVVGTMPKDYKGTSTVVLSKCGDVVEVRPLRIRDAVSISTRTPEVKALADDATAFMITPIVSIGGGEAGNIGELIEWHNALHPSDVDQLAAFVESITPHLNQSLPHKCDKCAHVWDHRLNLDQDFFRSGRMGTRRRALAASI